MLSYQKFLIFIIFSINPVFSEVRLVFERKVSEVNRMTPEIITSSKHDTYYDLIETEPSETDSEYFEIKTISKDRSTNPIPNSSQLCKNTIQRYEWTFEKTKNEKESFIKSMSLFKNTIKNNEFQLLTIHLIFKKNPTMGGFFENYSELIWNETVENLLNEFKEEGNLFSKKGFKGINPGSFCQVNSELEKGIEIKYVCFPEIIFGKRKTSENEAPSFNMEYDVIVDLNFAVTSLPCTNTRVHFQMKPIDFYMNSIYGFSKKENINDAYFYLSKYLKLSPAYEPNKSIYALEQFMVCVFKMAKYLRKTERESIFSKVELIVYINSNKFEECFELTRIKEA